MGNCSSTAMQLLQSELISHAREVLVYVAALSWTHAFLPTLGGPTCRSVPEMMAHKFRGPFLLFVLLYTSALTAFCFWWFRVAHGKAARVPRDGSMLHMILAACLDTSSKSMVRTPPPPPTLYHQLTTNPPLPPNPPRFGSRRGRG